MTGTERRGVLFRAGGLGDLLVALPAAALVRRTLPDWRLTLAARPEYGALFKSGGIVDDLVAFDDPRMAAAFAPAGPAARGRDDVGAARFSGWAFLSGCDLAFGWLNKKGEWPREREWERKGVGRALFVPYEPGPGLSMGRYFFDRTRHDLAGIRPASSLSSPARPEDGPGRPPAEARPEEPAPDPDREFDECSRLRVGPRVVERALGSLGLRPLVSGEKRLIVHPGSGGRAKRWPLPGFLEVVRRAAACGLAGVLVTGEAEPDLEAEVGRTALPAGWTRAARLDAMTLAGLLAGSTDYVGNDSGPTHLAAACGASVVALFLDGNLPAWRPFGRSRVISGPAVERIPFAAVLSEMGELLGV